MTRWLERTYRWAGWDWIRWGAPWLLLGLTLGAIITTTIDHFIP